MERKEPCRDSGVWRGQTRTLLIGLVWPFRRGSVGFEWEWCHSQGTGGGGSRISAMPKQNPHNSATNLSQESFNNELTEKHQERKSNTSKHKYNTSECSECALCVRKQKTSDIRITFIQDRLPELPEHILQTILTLVESASSAESNKNHVNPELSKDSDPANTTT